MTSTASTTTRMLYVGTYTETLSFVDGKGRGIYAFALDTATGELTPRGVTENLGVNVSFLAATARTVYAVNETGTAPQMPRLTGGSDSATGFVQALAIEADGALRVLNKMETQGDSPCHVSLAPSQRVLAVANYMGGNLTLFPLNESTGALGGASECIAFRGASLVNADRQEAPHVHSVTWLATPTGASLLAADLGNDRLAQFSLKEEEAKLTPAAEPFVTRPPGGGPRHVAVHPTLNVAYVVDELANTIGVHAVDEATGALAVQAHQNVTTLPEGFTAVSLAADIHISSCGQFVYASNRGHNSLACFRIDTKADGDAKGTLTPLAGANAFVATRGRSPRNFLIRGSLLLVANQDTDTIEVFRVDSDSGALTHTGHSVACPTPVCLCVPPTV